MKYTPPESTRERRFYGGTLKIFPQAKVLKLEVPQQAGFPDRLVVLPNNHHLFVELKRDGGSLRKLQEHRRQELQELGHTVMVIDDDAALGHYLKVLEYMRHPRRSRA